MRDGLNKVLLSGATLSLARLLSGLVRIKILSAILGIGGIGLFSWLTQFQSVGIAFVSMSMAVPIINLGRSHIVNSKIEDTGKLVGTAIFIVVINFILFIMITALFRERTGVIFGDGVFGFAIIFSVLLSIAISSFSTTAFEGVAYVSDRFDIYVRVGVITAVLDAVILSGAAWRYGFTGAAAALPLSASVMFFAYAALLLRDRTARAVLFAARVAPEVIVPMLKYSASMLATVAALMAVTTILRGYVITSAGAAANGALQVPAALSAYLLPFIMTGLWGHLHARAAEHGDVPSIREEFRTSIKFGAALSFVGTAGIAVTAPLIVPIVYSSDFSSAFDLVTGYMPGEFAFQVASMTAAYFLVVGLRRAYVAAQLSYALVLLLVAGLLIPKFGAAGYVVGHSAASLAYLGVAMSIACHFGQMTRRFAISIAAGLLVSGTMSALVLIGPLVGVSIILVRIVAALCLGCFGIAMVLIRPR